jgi:hypothetical protein
VCHCESVNKDPVRDIGDDLLQSGIITRLRSICNGHVCL